MIFVGIDWSERHHDVCVVDVEGTVRGKVRVPDGIQGVAQLHEVLAAHAEDPEEVIVGIETDRGLLVGALVAAGYHVFAINPLSGRAGARPPADVQPIAQTDSCSTRRAVKASGASRLVRCPTPSSVSMRAPGI